jgi:hypothetical protein
MAIDLREALVSQAASSIVVVHANGAPPRSPQRPDAYRATSRVTARNIAGAEATPATLFLSSLHHPQLRLQMPLGLRIERENGHVMAWSDDLEEIGYGPTLGAAVEDFQRTVVELYESLHDAQDHLGPDMERLWRVLQLHIGERE